MMREAAFVDVALAEERQPFLATPIAVELASFRTLRRLKGGSPDVFTLLAPSAKAGPQPLKDRPDDFGMYVDKAGRIYPIAARGEPEVPFSGARSSCDPGEITPEPGQLYVLFRGADGRLLRSARYYGDKSQPALPFRMVDPKQTDNWQIAVEGAAANWWRDGSPEASVKSTSRSDIARVTFRRLLSGAEVLRLLGRSGPRPFAVRVGAAGAYADETRLPVAYAAPTLVDRALAGAQRGLDRWGGPALAARLVAGVQEGDPGFSTFNPGIDLLAAATRWETARRGPALGVTSLELVGTQADWERLRNSSLVHSLNIGFSFQGEPVAPPLPLPVIASGRDGWSEKPEEVVAALRSLASGR